MRWVCGRLQWVCGCAMGLCGCAMGLCVRGGSVRACGGLVHAQRVFVRAQWVCGCAMDLCPCEMGLRSWADADGAPGRQQRTPARGRGSPAHRRCRAGGPAPITRSSPRGRRLPPRLSPLAPPQPSCSPRLLYTSAKKARKIAKALNVFFHQFSSTFGVSAAAFSPNSCSSPLKKSSFVVYCHQYLDGNNPLLILHLISWI